jgi:hypothetical protein
VLLHLLDQLTAAVVVVHLLGVLHHHLLGVLHHHLLDQLSSVVVVLLHLLWSLLHLLGLQGSARLQLLQQRRFL